MEPRENRDMPPSPARGPAADGGALRVKTLIDIAFNVAMIVLFLFLFVRAGALPDSRYGVLGAGAFPRILFGLAMALNVFIVIRLLGQLRRTGAISKSIFSPWFRRHRLMFGLLILFSIYIVTVPIYGYAWPSLFFLLLAQLLLGAYRNWVSFLIACIVAVLFSFGAQTVFKDVFGILLPGVM